MGLDICVFRPVALHIAKRKYNPDNYSGVQRFLLSKHPSLEVFEKFIEPCEVEYFDTDAELQKLGHDPAKCECIASSHGEDNEFQFYDPDGNMIKIVNPGTCMEKDKCLYAKVVGAQRKGANKHFYADGMWDSGAVLKLDVLKHHHKTYFSSDNKFKDGNLEQVPFGFGVETNLDAELNREQFQKNIVDKFVEGKTFVLYC